jgi:hypothetical protein
MLDRVKRECPDCGDEIPDRGHRVRCVPCARLRKLETDAAAKKLWRAKLGRDPERYAAYVQKNKQHQERYRRSLGMRPQAVVAEEKRKRSAKLIPKIEAMQQRGLSCAEIGERLSITKNAVIGLIDRNRKRQAVKTIF